MQKLISISCLFLLTTVAHATPSITEHQTYYKINGNTAEQLRAQMTTLGPLDHNTRVDAKTTWYINWRYNWHYDNPSQNPCYVTSVQITGDVTYLYPEWSNQSQGDAALQSKWNIYLNNLATHEQGHANNGKQAAAEIEKALLNARPQTNCSILQTTLDNTAKNILAQHNAWDIQYDADTDHGKKQGAIFP